MSFITVPLNSTFVKKSFSCGNETLDNYLHKQANQDIRRYLSACFILPGQNNTILGYYTLSNDRISQDLLPFEIARSLPNSYKDLPVTLLGRLAIDKQYKGQGLGGNLLLDALYRCYISSLQIGSMAVVVDPIDDNAISFYQQYDFIMLPDSRRMFLSMDTVKSLFNSVQ
jgi:hypothetical protein